MVKINNKFWQNKRVFITGHTGFKGSWLTLWLRMLGAKVFGYSLEEVCSENLFNELYSNKVKYFEKDFYHHIGNILDQEKLNNAIKDFQPEIVIHLAAQALVRKSYKEPIKTWETNVMGSIRVLESLKNLQNNCAVVMVTTDKVYKNNEWIYGYRENDRLGGNDPYSASKAACEIAIDSWRKSFCGNFKHQSNKLNIATARSGNVIGGGDWSEDRIIPDAVRALKEKKPIIIRNPHSVRPWQHVLDPLSGYLKLAELLTINHTNIDFCSSFNFGPHQQNQIKVSELINMILEYWPGGWEKESFSDKLEESKLLTLEIEKAKSFLKWEPTWDLKSTASHTINWYKKYSLEGISAFECCKKDIEDFQLDQGA